MIRFNFLAFLFAIFIFFAGNATAQIASADEYLSDLKIELTKQWPKNRTINLVFHGHSVPSGYFKTPDVKTLEAYPHLLLVKLKQLYPYAVINVITTSIGGENSERGQKRMDAEVLNHKPDVLFVDYGLNDRALGLEKSRLAMEKIIAAALDKHIKVILLTPSPDQNTDILKPGNALELQSNQLLRLAEKYQIGLADCFARFKELAITGKDMKELMSQRNHPNQQGHLVMANELVKYFEKEEK